MATQPDTTPDTVVPQAPPEAPVPSGPTEAPDIDMPGVGAPPPDYDQPDSTPAEAPMLPD